MNNVIDLQLIENIHRDSIIRWKASGVQPCHQDFAGLVEMNHAFNYQLWHAEDRARRNDMGHKFVYLAKREIDDCNQKRNNLMEAMDEWLYTQLNPAAPTHCSVHSETPGMMIDRLSIMALKAYHMNIQASRNDVDDSHRVLCQKKLNTILAQQKQLSACLEQFISEIIAQTRTFRIYHQFKMYNDPALNPQLYNKELA